MDKIKLGPQHLLNPRPAILAGTCIGGKPNFITVSWCGIASADPPAVSLAIRNKRYSLTGFKENETFSINIPSAGMFRETDYCGVVSGTGEDKAEKCGFRLFDGQLKNAPMIEQCPVNMQCEILDILPVGDHSLVLGRIVESYISADCFTDGKPDIRKIDPLCFCAFTGNAMGYYTVGDFIAETFSAGGLSGKTSAAGCGGDRLPAERRG